MAMKVRYALLVFTFCLLLMGCGDKSISAEPNDKEKNWQIKDVDMKLKGIFDKYLNK